jgi:hypothetical protein
MIYFTFDPRSISSHFGKTSTFLSTTKFGDTLDPLETMTLDLIFLGISKPAMAGILVKHEYSSMCPLWP